jgi:thiamine-phosphate pyrophosphorylase
LKKPLKGLYLISPPLINDSFIPQLQAALNPKICAFQLRLKDMPDEAITAWAEKIKPLLGSVPLIINDSPKLALRVKAAGVHLGQEDMELSAARELLGDNFIIGASAYDSFAKARCAETQGADYICFGAFFTTTTKQTKTRATPSLLSDWRKHSTLAVGGIGGITPANAKALVADGTCARADFIAVSSAVWQAENIPRTIQAFQNLL